MNHSAAGPKRKTIPIAKIPKAMPKRNRPSTITTTKMPYEKIQSPNTNEARASMITRPKKLVIRLAATSPRRYSEIRSGVAKILRKLRDQTSSKNEVEIPNMARVKKSQSNTAPKSVETKLKVD